MMYSPFGNIKEVTITGTYVNNNHLHTVSKKSLVVFTGNIGTGNDIQGITYSSGGLSGSLAISTTDDNYTIAQGSAVLNSGTQIKAFSQDSGNGNSFSITGKLTLFEID